VICSFDCYQNQRPWMTLNGRTARYCTNDGSFGTHHGNVEQDKSKLSAAKMYPQGLYFQSLRGFMGLHGE